MSLILKLFYSLTLVWTTLPLADQPPKLNVLFRACPPRIAPLSTTDSVSRPEATRAFPSWMILMNDIRTQALRWRTQSRDIIQA